MIWIRTVALLLAALALLSAGCNNPGIQRERARRDGNIRRTVGYIAESERRRPDNLRKTSRVIEEQHRRDVENTLETNPRRVREWTHFEFQRWEANQPGYRQRIDEQLRGNPLNIERTIPYIFN